MISVGNDNSGYRCGLGKLSQLVIGQDNRIDNVNAAAGQDCARKEISFYGGIIGLPKPEAGQKVMKIGRRHGGRVPETAGLARWWHYRCFTRYRNYKMITFAYQARDASGRIVSGIQDALNEDNAVTSLMSRGLMVLSLQKKAAGRSRKKTWTVKETDLVLFTRQLATMIEAGISLVQGLTALYDQSDPKLPAPTQFLIDVSDFVRSEWYFLVVGIGSLIFGTRTFLRSTRGKQLADRWKLKLPVFGPLVHKICMSRFARTFAQLIRSGVPILEVLDIVGGTSGNHVVETAIKEVGADVEKGDNLSVSLSRKSIFPPMLLRMVAAGEATGKIDTMLEKMADFWDEEIEAMLDALTSLIEPMLIVFVGLIVGGIVIAMFLPIFM